jgi:hypothetical protein
VHYYRFDQGRQVGVKSIAINACNSWLHIAMDHARRIEKIQGHQS